MAHYSVLLKPSIEKDLRPLPRSIISRIMQRIRALAEEPLPRSAVKLAGAERTYRLRVGDYRVVYSVDVDAKVVTVHYVRHRSDAYRTH